MSTGRESERSTSSTQSGNAMGVFLERQITFRDFCSIINSIGVNLKGGNSERTLSSGGAGSGRQNTDSV